MPGKEAEESDAEKLSASRAERDSLRTQLTEQTVLFQEVHHRVKNNLQLLNALVTIIRARFPDQAVSVALHELEDRISAIGLVHELLYRKGKASTVDLADYVQGVAESVRASSGAAERGVALAVEADTCPVGMDTAITVGLLLTEVLTNAIKHAFPPGRMEGIVSLSLRALQDNRWRLVVRDNGVGMLPNATGGIGCSLVKTLASQLSGEIAVRSQGGTEVTLTFPIEDGPPQGGRSP